MTTTSARRDERSWWNAFTRSWFLIGEHAHVDLSAARTVACKQCGQIYNQFGDEAKGSIQANELCPMPETDEPQVRARPCRDTTAGDSACLGCP